MNKVVIRLLKDGSGRIRIHWFRHHPLGLIQTPGSVRMTALGPFPLGGKQGMIACQPSMVSVNPKVQGGKTEPCCHSDDVRAANCPECLATPEAKVALENYAEILHTTQ